MPQVSTTAEPQSDIQQWMRDQQTLRELNELKAQKQSELDAIAEKIRQTWESVCKCNPDLGADALVVRPTRRIDPNDGRPFAISTGRKVKEAKMVLGKTRDEARKFALDRLWKLATDPKGEYKLEKPPQAAIDRVEEQLDEFYPPEE
jgi:uncharacterized coiled-coil protein SlyX